MNSSATSLPAVSTPQHLVPESRGSSHTAGVGGARLSLKGTVKLAVLEVRLTIAKDCYTSDYSSDVERQCFGSHRACVKRYVHPLFSVFVTQCCSSRTFLFTRF